MFLGDLRKSGKIENLAIAFVAQKSNIHELLDFSELAVKINANIVTITRIEDWSIYYRDYYLKTFELPLNWKDIYKDLFDKVRVYLNDNNICYYSNVI